MTDLFKAHVDAFLGGEPFAVVGASNDRRKFGNKVLRCYWEHGLRAFPVNPREREVEGQPCFKRLADLPERVHGVSLITQPAVSEGIVDEALALGIERLWFQPGAEHMAAIARATEAGVAVIYGGTCVLVELPRRR
jgi:predicted CoA-binding protein